MAKEIDPDVLLEHAVAKALVELFPEARLIHATLFTLASEGGYTLEEAVAETGECEATLTAAFNDLLDRGLIQDTSPWEMTDEGDKLFDDALDAATELLRERIALSHPV